MHRSAHYAAIGTDVDLADLYYRIKGRKHVSLKGHLSSEYAVFLRHKGEPFVRRDPFYRGPWPSRECEALAKELGFSAATLNRIEKGDTPSGENLAKILGWLLDG